MSKLENTKSEKEKTKNSEYLREYEWFQCGMDFSVVWLFTYLSLQSQTFSSWLNCSKILSLHSHLLEICLELLSCSLLLFSSLFDFQNSMIRTMEFHGLTISQWYGILIGSYSHWLLWCFSLVGLYFHYLEMDLNGKKSKWCLRLAIDIGGQIYYCLITWYHGFQRLWPDVCIGLKSSVLTFSFISAFLFLSSFSKSKKQYLHSWWCFLYSYHLSFLHRHFISTTLLLEHFHWKTTTCLHTYLNDLGGNFTGQLLDV